MAQSYHEPTDQLSNEAMELHRGINSLIEELEAVNWYNQRADVTADDELKATVLHNRDEEIEHAAMLIEWLRRRLPAFDEELRTYLFTEMGITEVEEAAEEDEESEETEEAKEEAARETDGGMSDDGDGSLGIRSGR
jgi:hypothetical protein